jgi:hypothetical protein
MLIIANWFANLSSKPDDGRFSDNIGARPCTICRCGRGSNNYRATSNDDRVRADPGSQ